MRTSCCFVSLQLQHICSICFRLHSLEDHAFGMLFLLLQTLVLECLQSSTFVLEGHKVQSEVHVDNQEREYCVVQYTICPE